MANFPTLDYAILKVLAEEDTALWKKKIHDLVEHRSDVLPEPVDVSLQTIGRHVDTMQDEGLVNSKITSPNELDRVLIIGYELTEDGSDQLDAYRRDLLKQYARESTLLSASQGDPKIADKRLRALIVDEFELDAAEQDMLGDVGAAALGILLYCYVAEQQIFEHTEPTVFEQLGKLMQHCPSISAAVKTLHAFIAQAGKDASMDDTDAPGGKAGVA